MPCDAETMRALIERVEAATGPDRELDVAIWCVGPLWSYETDRRPSKVPGRGVAYYKPHEGDVGSTGVRLVPDYTRSLDAAVSLVPEDEPWTLMRHENGRYYAECGDNMQVIAATPALALVAAALRARLAGELGDAS